MISSEGICPDPCWKEIADLLVSRDSPDGVYVCGPVDSGKSSFSRFLADTLGSEFCAAYVDCDPGQSFIGPPATVGMTVVRNADRQAPALRFVGSTSPSGRLLQMLAGVRRLADRAVEAGAQKIVFDSCGLATGGLAEELHFQMIDILQPTHIAALQKEDEMEPILARFRARGTTRIWRFPVSPAVRRRNCDQRREYREDRFREYFRQATSRQIALNGIGLHGMVPEPGIPRKWAGRLVAFCDSNAFVLALGIAEDLDARRGWMRAFAPSFKTAELATVQFGTLSLAPSGEEIP